MDTELMRSCKFLSLPKRGLKVGLIAGTSLLILSVIGMIAYTAAHIGSYGCPAFVDRVNCRWSDVGLYILQALLIAGLPALLVCTALGWFIGWSISDGKILLWEGIFAGSFVLLAAGSILVASISDAACRTLFGDGIQFGTLGICVLLSILPGAGVGAIVSRFSRRHRPE